MLSYLSMKINRNMWSLWHNSVLRKTISCRYFFPDLFMLCDDILRGFDLVDAVSQHRIKMVYYQ